MYSLNKRLLSKAAVLILFSIICILMLSNPAARAEGDGSVDELLPPVGSALVEAGQSRWDAAAADVEAFAALWRTANANTPDPALAGPAAAVDAALADAAAALRRAMVRPPKRHCPRSQKRGRVCHRRLRHGRR
ncbi:hypothetical protein QNH28_24390 [Paenibacillus sp. G2S3]|uniref:hypothetical protein n=1 Tax=Paenibacillus sp. G2S3 TaxID=3047872 RepID=UPI0024C1AA65|nr:hypothetical protein [Paenibacillus sp. G2S3]WHY18570.1 hypothetical protein QNH28_24390 [Paenibacillus sp. G2S3]